VELLFFDFYPSGTPKVVNISPKRFKQYGVLADLPLLTDGNEGLTAYNTILSSTVATVGLLYCSKTFRRKVAYLLIAYLSVAYLVISNSKQIQKKFH
jgi:hypothetical protein